MTRQQDNEIWLEYQASFQQQRTFTPYELAENLRKERDWRKEQTRDAGKFAAYCPLEAYRQKLADIALVNCKSRAEWQNADGISFNLDTSNGVMVHKSACELLERYQNKATSAFHTIQWYAAQIKHCDEEIEKWQKQIAELNHMHRPRAQRSAQNKLKHWRERHLMLEIQMSKAVQKNNFLEQKVMKWMGITEKIKIAAIAREIRKEIDGCGNKYGFNPNMQSRETATDIFSDFEN